MSDLDEILAVLRCALPELQRRWPIRSLSLFGSVARDEARPESDLDMLVEFDAPIGLTEFLALEERLTAITERRVELVSRKALKPYISYRVLQEALRV